MLKKAQAEIDRVVGPNRLPKFPDREELPYVNALVKEVLRWHSVIPVGELDFVHDGYIETEWFAYSTS